LEGTEARANGAWRTAVGPGHTDAVTPTALPASRFRVMFLLDVAPLRHEQRKEPVACLEVT
jgi:hypothetical protein